MNKEITEMASHLLQELIELTIMLENYNGPNQHTKERWDANILARNAEACVRSVYHLTKENQ